jgi:hypothetical protein
MLIFVYDYIDVTKFNNYMFNFLSRCLFKNFSHFSSIDVTASILRRWRIVCVACETFGVGLGEWMCSRWCVCVGIVWFEISGLNDYCSKNHSFFL